MSKVVGDDGHDRPLYELEAEADECSQAVADAQVRRERRERGGGWEGGGARSHRILCVICSGRGGDK